MRFLKRLATKMRNLTKAEPPFEYANLILNLPETGATLIRKDSDSTTMFKELSDALAENERLE